MSSGRSIGSGVGLILGAVAGYLLAPATGGLSAGAATALIVGSIGTGAALGSTAGSLAGGLYDQSQQQPVRNEQETIMQFFAQTSSLGMPIPQYIGHGRGAGNIVYLGERYMTEHEDREGGGNKGGPSQGVTVTKTYQVDLVIEICDTRLFGPLHGQGIRKIWRDSTLWYDANADGPGNWPMSGFTFYPGSALGAPSPMIEAVKGAGNVPGWPHMARIDLDNYELGNYPRVPIFSFQVFQEGSRLAAHHQMTRRPSDGSIWLAAPGVNAVYVLDGTTQDQTHDIDVSVTDAGNPGTNPSIPYATRRGFPMGWENGSDALWIAHPHDYQLKRLDGATKAVTHVFPTLYSLLSGGIYHEGDMWWCAYHYGTKVGYVLRANSSGVTTITAGQARGGQMMLVAGSATAVWVTDNHYPDGGGQSALLRINPATNTITATVALGAAAASAPVDVVMTPSNLHKWVLDAQAQTVIRIDTTPAVSATIALAGTPLQLAVASDGYVWACTTLQGGTVYRLNPADNSVQAFESLPLREYSPAHRLMTPGPAGSMWVLSLATWVTQRFTTTGTTTDVSTAGTPRAMLAEDTTHVWTSTTRGAVQRVTDAGAVVMSPSLDLSQPRLKQTLTRLSTAVGIPSDQLDFTALTSNPLVATQLTTLPTAREVLETLMVAYQFFVIESNLGLKFLPRAPGAVVATITEDELDAYDADGDPPGFAGLQILGYLADEELPTELTLSYPTVTRQYQTETQTARVRHSRATAPTAKHVSTSIVLTPTQARRLAEELLDQAWMQRTSYRWTTNRDYAHLEPGDRVLITSRGLQHSIILGEIRQQEPGILEFLGRGDHVDTIGQPLAFQGGAGMTYQRPLAETPTTAVLLNLPALDSADQTPRYHVGFSAAPLAWPGAALLRSVDDGLSYTTAHTGVVRATVGIVASAMAAGDWYRLDRSTTFTVVLAPGGTMLTSVSEAQLFGGANRVMVGEELLSFLTATLTAPRTYVCSVLWRGQRGTEWAVATHGVTETFVLLTGAVVRLDMPLAERAVLRQYKGVTSGTDAALASVVAFTATSPNLQPWTVAHPEAELEGSDWVLTWYLRSRFAGDWIDGEPFGSDPDVLLSRVFVYTDATYETVVRTIDVALTTTPDEVQTVTYTSSQQTTDFGSPQSTLYWRVGQVSSYGLGRTTDLVGV